MRSLFSPFPVRSGDAGSDVSDTGEDKQSRLRGDHLWGDAVLHPSRVPSGCRHPAEPLCCARSTRASLTLLLHPISHTRERRGRKDGLPGGADGHLSAAICQEISALDCALTKKKKPKKRKMGKKPPPSVRFLITWSSDAMWKKKFGSSSLFSLSEQERSSLVSHIYHSTPHPFGKAAKRGPLP